MSEGDVPIFLPENEESVTSAGHALVDSIKARRDHGRADARELRRALDELGALVEDANKHACVVEDAFGLDDPVADFERLGEAEQAKARAEMPGALEALAEIGNRIHRQLWVMARARRGLAKILRAGQGKP